LLAVHNLAAYLRPFGRRTSGKNQELLLEGISDRRIPTCWRQGNLNLKFEIFIMEVKGKVIQLLPVQSGMGKKGQWKKQEFIIETQAQFPKKICLSAWGDKVDQFGLSVGDMVTVAVDLESREYNGRWYTEARAWKLEKTGQQSAPPADEEPFFNQETPSTDDMPF
jgi:hypothetical protein